MKRVIILLVILLAIPPAVAKPLFAVRHPVLHKIGRKMRKECQVLQPILNALGSVAQVGAYFKR